MNRLPPCLAWAFACVATTASPSAMASASALGTPTTPGAAVYVQGRECQRQLGPFVTQGTAWQRRNEVQSQGYGVSGVFICPDGAGGRAYCFNVFFPC